MILPLAILLVPFAILRSGVLHIGHQWGFMILALLVVAHEIKNIWIKSFIWYITIWSLYIMISVMNTPASFSRAYSAHGSLVYMALAFTIYLGVLRSKFDKEIFYKVIRVSVLVQTFLALVQLGGYDIWCELMDGVKTGGGITTGSLGNTNFLSAYLAIGAPLFMIGRWRWCLIPIVVVILLSDTTTSVLSVACGLGAYFGLGYAMLMFGVALLFPIFFDDPLVESPRWTWWSSALNRMVSEPYSFITGFGPEADTGYKFPLHNEWLELLYFNGLIGVGLAVGYIRSIISFKDRMLFGSFIAILVNCLGNYPIHLAPSLLLIIVILALMERDRCQTI